MQGVKQKALELIRSGKCVRVLGWKTGEFFYDLTPAVFETESEIEKEFVYSPFCGANLSKYLIAETKKDGRVAVFLKPCDSFSFVQLLKEHRIDRDKTYIVGVECSGMCDMDKLKARGLKGITAVHENGGMLECETMYGSASVPMQEALAERCTVCKSKKVQIFDEMLGKNGENTPEGDRFAQVAELEKMTAEERFAFWKKELSRCIRCNACRNVCPACSCEKCVFDNDTLGTANKAAATSFEEQNFHIIRAFHVAGRCTDCGECSRVCPQKIPLHLLNRKFIKDINELYGTYQAGADLESRAPLTDFRAEDCEPSIVLQRGGK